MTTSQIPFEPGAFTTPVVDYEPPPFDVAVGGPAPDPAVAGRAAVCPAPTTAALNSPPRRPRRPAQRAETTPPPVAAAFADAVLRRVLEVIDRRRPIAQLRPMLTPALLDMVFTMTRGAAPDKAAVLRRVRLRSAAAETAEVFATYTRGRRVRAIAGRIEVKEGRWRLTALQVG
ncbi:MAG: Rv3235 family protein [Mycobacterium sp.]